MDGLRFFACFLSLISLFLLLVALISNYWAIDKSTNAGLWETCEKNICTPYGMQVPVYMHTTRAFLLMGIVAGTVSFFSLWALFFQTHIGSVSIKRLAESTSVLAGVFSMIAMLTFTGMYNHQLEYHQTWFGWSWIIGWTAFPLFLLTSWMEWIMKTRKKRRQGLFARLRKKSKKQR